MKIEKLLMILCVFFTVASAAALIMYFSNRASTEKPLSVVSGADSEKESSSEKQSCSETVESKAALTSEKSKSFHEDSSSASTKEDESFVIQSDPAISATEEKINSVYESSVEINVTEKSDQTSDSSSHIDVSEETVPETLQRVLTNAGYSIDDIENRNCRQLITVSSSGSDAVVSLYQKNSVGIWENSGLDTDGFVGSMGVSNNSREGSYETPFGLYRVGDAFYIDTMPETHLNTFRVTEDTYWVDDPESVFYNKKVEGTDNKDWNSAEHMIDYYSSYRYGFVIEFNTENTVPGKGSAIFFHISSGPTAGCVGVSEYMVQEYLRTLNVEMNPYILIL